MKQKIFSGKTGQRYSVDRINDLCIIISLFTLVFNFLTSFFIQKETLPQIISKQNIWIIFLFTLIFFIFRYIKNKKLIKTTHVLLFLLTSFLSTQGQFNSPYGIFLWVLAVVISYSYGFFNNQKIIKLVTFGLFIVISVQLSAYRAGYYTIGFQTLSFLIFFIVIIYLAFKNELAKIFRQEIRFKDKYTQIINEKTRLEEKIIKDKERLEELENFYQEFSSRKQKFNLSRYHLTPSEIDIIQLLVTTNDNYTEIGKKLNRTEAAVKQSVYRINNKIGIDTRIELCRLCQFNWPESAGKF